MRTIAYMLESFERDFIHIDLHAYVDCRVSVVSRDAAILEIDFYFMDLAPLASDTVWPLR